MEIYSSKPFLAMVASFLGAILIVAARKKPNLREGCSIAAGIAPLAAHHRRFRDRAGGTCQWQSAYGDASFRIESKERRK